MLKYVPKKKMAMFIYSFVGFTAFLGGIIFAFVPLTFGYDWWWLPFALMSVGLMFLGSVSILVGAMKE